MTREKPGSAHRRVIMDLSYPKGKIVNAEIVKDIYLGLPCILTLPTIDNITNITKKKFFYLGFYVAFNNVQVIS